MKRNPGKIILVLLFSVSLLAGVKATVEQSAIYKGESVNLTITAEGNDVDFPQIDDIDGFRITGTSSSQSTRIINGDISKSVSKTYSFSPSRDVIIPSYALTVDGKRELTKAIPIHIVKPSSAAGGSDFMVELFLNKHEAYVGESIILDVTFKRRLNAKADKIQINEPKIENFWIKKAKESRQDSEGDYLTETYTYLLFPQKDGNFTIPPLQADIGTVHRTRSGGFFNDPFFDRFNSQIRWRKIFSDEAKLTVKPLPQNLELYGSFTISAKVDKQQVHANKPVNLTVTVTGEGNVEDIVKFDPVINDTIVYADDPKTEGELLNGQYSGTFRQKIAVIGDRDFQIPSLTLRYFDGRLKKVVTKATKPITIKVIGSTAAKRVPNIEQNPSIIASNPVISAQSDQASVKTVDTNIKYLYLLIGLFIGALGMYAAVRYAARSRSKKDIPLLKAIQKARNDRDLFNLLLPFGKTDPLIDETLEHLEANIYTDADNAVDKKVLLEFFEDHPHLLNEEDIGS